MAELDPAIAQMLPILVCPETRQPLAEAPADLVARLAAAQAGGTLKNRSGQPAGGPIESGLLRQDGKYLYPVIDGIPVLLIDEAIPAEA